MGSVYVCNRGSYRIYGRQADGGSSRVIFKIRLAVILALIIKVAGYYIAEAVIYGNLAAPLASIPEMSFRSEWPQPCSL